MESFTFKEYNTKSIVVQHPNGSRDHPEHKTIVSLGGRWNPRLQCGPGWTLPIHKKDEFLKSIQKNLSETLSNQSSPQRSESVISYEEYSDHEPQSSDHEPQSSDEYRSPSRSPPKTPPVEQPVKTKTPPVEQPVKTKTPPVEQPVKTKTPPVVQPVKTKTPPVEQPVEQPVNTKIKPHSSKLKSSLLSPSLDLKSKPFPESIDIFSEYKRTARNKNSRYHREDSEDERDIPEDVIQDLLAYCNKFTREPTATKLVDDSHEFPSFDE